MLCIVFILSIQNILSFIVYLASKSDREDVPRQGQALPGKNLGAGLSVSVKDILGVTQDQA